MMVPSRSALIYAGRLIQGSVSAGVVAHSEGTVIVVR